MDSQTRRTFLVGTATTLAVGLAAGCVHRGGTRAGSERAEAEDVSPGEDLMREHEDTVLFPAFHVVVGHEEYESLGEVFEDREHQLFGARGFDAIVEEVAQLERTIGLYDLSQFTPSR